MSSPFTTVVLIFPPHAMVWNPRYTLYIYIYIYIFIGLNFYVFIYSLFDLPIYLLTCFFVDICTAADEGAALRL